MKLREVAHARAGDKGNISSISVIAYRPEDYPRLEKQLTAERVKSHFEGLVRGNVLRYELPQLGALNFVMYEALSGGVTCSLGLDGHGKALSFVMLDMDLDA
jgi:hypothetical protein